MVSKVMIDIPDMRGIDHKDKGCSTWTAGTAEADDRRPSLRSSIRSDDRHVMEVEDPSRSSPSMRPTKSMLMSRARGVSSESISGSLAGSASGRATSSRLSFDTKSFMSERVDSKISARYDIENRAIGAGGFGKVYIAKDRMFQNRLVAIKRVVKLSGEMGEALCQEVQIMKDLDHPCICRLFETYNEARFMFFVMEYCEGGDLYERLSETDDGYLPEQVVADIIQQVARALKYAHSRGIAHRDLKPENICFCYTPEHDSSDVKVIDWGFGKYFGQGRMKSNVGTATYAAPEVLEMKECEPGYTCSCDLWGLGVVAYSALCGSPPFQGSLQQQLKNRRQELVPMEEPPWDTISAEAKEFIRALLRFDPQQRLSIDSTLAHPWLTARRAEVCPAVVSEVLSNLEQFSHASDFFSICVGSVARQLDHSSLGDIRKVFGLLDTNADGVLDVEEVRVSYATYFGQEISQEDVAEIFSHLDLDGTGRITFTEFSAAGLGERSYTEEHVLWAAFKTFDLRDDGRISCEEMVQVLSHVDVNRVWSNSVCEEVAREVMQEFGGENGSIDFQEWLRLMRHCAWRHQDGCARRLSRRMDTASSIILTPTVSGFLETPQSEFMAASFTRDDEPSDVSPSAEEPSDSGCPSHARTPEVSTAALFTDPATMPTAAQLAAAPPVAAGPLQLVFREASRTRAAEPVGRGHGCRPATKVASCSSGCGSGVAQWARRRLGSGG